MARAGGSWALRALIRMAGMCYAPITCCVHSCARLQRQQSLLRSIPALLALQPAPNMPQCLVTALVSPHSQLSPVHPYHLQRRHALQNTQATPALVCLTGDGPQKGAATGPAKCQERHSAGVLFWRQQLWMVRAPPAVRVLGTVRENSKQKEKKKVGTMLQGTEHS